MRNVVALALAFGLVSPLAHAEGELPATVPCPCDACTPPPAPPNLAAPTASELTTDEDHSAKTAILVSLGLFAAGAAVATVHALGTSTSGRGYDLIPVAGPAIEAFGPAHEQPWGSALMFAAWAEAAGIVTAVGAAAYLATTPHPMKVSLGASVSPGRASIGVSGHF